EGRDQIEDGRQQVEEAAIAEQVQVVEDRGVLEERGIERQQLDAVDVLHLLVVGDTVILEGQDGHHRHAQQHQQRQIVESVAPTSTGGAGSLLFAGGSGVIGRSRGHARTLVGNGKPYKWCAGSGGIGWGLPFSSTRTKVKQPSVIFTCVPPSRRRTQASTR